MFANAIVGAYKLAAQLHRDGVLFRGATELRRGAAIAGFVGPNGGGKSFGMLMTTIPSLEAGRRVLSTVRLIDYENARPCDDGACTCDKQDPRRHLAAHPAYEPWRSWDQLMRAEGCDVLADEVTGVASSREYSSLPAPIANLLVQLRRRDVCLRWTAPNWRRADVIIRECTQMATVCTGLFPRVNRDADRAWIENRLLKLVSFDAALMDDFDAGRRDDLEVWTRQWVWLPKSGVRSAYDTYDSVSTIGSVSETGRCMTCGGMRRAPACSCADYNDGRKGGAAAAKIVPILPGTPRRALLSGGGALA